MTGPWRPEAVDAPGLGLDPEPLATGAVVEGAPATASRELWAAPAGAAAIGVWEITAGTVTDVEADETFVVLSGSATVEIEDGPTLELRPGTVGRLRAGDRTVWRVRETVRKVYVLHG